MTTRNLKKLYTLEIVFFSILIAIILGVCSSCSSDDEESATAKTERLLRSEWQLDKLTVDGTDQTALFPGLTITIAAGTYTTQNGEPVWPASGTWNLTDATTINRDNNMTITVREIDASHLTLSLQWTKTTYSGGRATSVNGEHIFELVNK